VKQEEFSILRDLVNQESGIFISDSKRDLLVSCLNRRLKSVGVNEPAEYIKSLLNNSSGNELQELIDEVSTNVTSFFREPSHFDFTQKLALEVYKQRQEPVRIWCAGSSTGEEAYSVAIVLLESGLEAWQVRIVATDISCSALKKATEGYYKKKELETINQSLVSKYFDFDEDRNQYRVKSFLRNLVKFKQSNLVNTPSEIPGPIDIIFCRNVMIYFKPELRAKLVLEFQRLLAEGGYLFVGHSEAIPEHKDIFKFIDSTIYQKKSVETK